MENFIPQFDVADISSQRNVALGEINTSALAINSWPCCFSGMNDTLGKSYFLFSSNSSRNECGEKKCESQDKTIVNQEARQKWWFNRKISPRKKNIFFVKHCTWTLHQIDSENEAKWKQQACFHYFFIQFEDKCNYKKKNRFLFINIEIESYWPN